MTATPKITKNERQMLRDMLGGWTPFPFQIPDTGKSLEKKGLIRADYDDKGRLSYFLTDDGRAAIGATPSPESEPVTAIKPTVQATPLLTAERGLEQLQYEADRAKARYVNALELFATEAALNPMNAIACCDDVIKAQEVWKWWDAAMAVAKGAARDGKMAVEQLHLLRDDNADNLHRFIDSECWQPNSTSLGGNVVKIVSASGRAEALGKIRDVVEWVLRELAKESTS